MTRDRLLRFAGLDLPAARPQPRPSSVGVVERDLAHDGDTRHLELKLLGVTVLDPPELTDEARALIAALDEFSGETRSSFNPAEHPRNPKGAPGGGRFRSLVDRVLGAVETWSKGDGPDDPFEGFDREQLRQVAKHRGISLRRGATRDEIVEALKADVRSKRAGAKDAKSPDTGKPVRFTLTGGSVDPAKVREVEVENHIRAAYRDALAAGAGPFGRPTNGRELRPGSHIMLADLRERVAEDHNIRTAEFDMAMKRLATADGVSLAPQEDQKRLTPRQRSASVRFGDEDMHMVAIADPSPRPVPKADSKLRDLDVGVYSEGGKVSLWEVSDSGERRRRVALVDDLAGLAAWADEHGESELAGWARKERGGAEPGPKTATAPTQKTPGGAIRPIDLNDGDHVVWQPPGEPPVLGRVVKVGRFKYVDWNSGRRERLYGTSREPEPNMRLATAEDIAKHGPVTPLDDAPDVPAKATKVVKKAAPSTKATLRGEAVFGALPIRDADSLDKATDGDFRIRDAIGDYEDQGYQYVNHVLRTTGGDTSKFPESVPAVKGLIPSHYSRQRALDQVEGIDAVMASSRSTVPVVLHRAVVDLPSGWPKRNPAGFEWTDHAFVSTSADGRGIAKFGHERMEIHVPAGTGAIGIDNSQPGLRGEREVLLQRGLRFRVTGTRTEGGLAIHEVEVVPQGGPKPKAPAKSAPTAQPTDLDTLDPEAARDELDLRKVDELKALLREQKLPVSGRKRELVDRLVEHLGGPKAGAAPAKADEPAVRTFPPGQHSWSGHDGLDVTDEEEANYLSLPAAEQDEITNRIRSGSAAVAGGARGTHFGTLPDRSLVVPPEREAEIRAEVEQIARQAGRRVGAKTYLPMKALREGLADRFPRAEVDNVIQKLNRSGDWYVVAEANQKVLTPRDRLAAVVIGNQDKHTLAINTFGPPPVAKKADVSAAPSRPAKPGGRTPATPVPIHDLFKADTSDAQIEAALKDVFEGKFGPYTTKVQVGIRRAGTRTDSRGREQKIEPSIWVEGKIYDEQGHEIGDFGRSIGPVDMHYADGSARREVWAEHHIVQLGTTGGDGYDEKYHGKGFGGEFNRRAIDWYRASGVHGIGQKDHNGYVWASQGFNFGQGGRVPDSLVADIRQLIADLRAGRTTTDATKDEYHTIPKRFREAPDLDTQIAKAEELLARLDTTKPGEPDYPTAYEISQLGRRAGQRGKTSLWLGKLLWVSADQMILNPDEGEVISQ